MKATLGRISISLAGLSPQTIALIVAVGFVLGVFPMYGVPTLLCAAAALILRRNVLAVQLINQLSSPLQLALLIPLDRFGARLIGGHPAWSLAAAARNAIVGWFCLCVPLGLVLYLFLLFTLRRRYVRLLKTHILGPDPTLPARRKGERFSPDPGMVLDSVGTSQVRSALSFGSGLQIAHFR